MELIMRPTGILDPQVEVRPSEGQMDNLLAEVYLRVERGERTLVTTLTKQMAEDLSAFLLDHGVKTAYMHSDVKSLERMAILSRLRDGVYDVLVGVNLLREGLDLPEVSLVAVLDADKEGFLRSTTSLIQTIGRAARHCQGFAILYADRITRSMEEAMAETERRRELQVAFNDNNGIMPQALIKKHGNLLLDLATSHTPAGQARERSRKGGKEQRLAERATLDPVGVHVYDAIYEWRSELARSRRKRPFRIVQARTILELARQRPRSEEALLQVIIPIPTGAIAQI